jgi:hypothetical protein
LGAARAQIALHLVLCAEVQYGLEPWQALQTAAIPAGAFGYEKDLGSVEPGKLADLTIVDGNPPVDINDLVKTKSVTANGRYYTIADLIAPFSQWTSCRAYALHARQEFPQILYISEAKVGSEVRKQSLANGLKSSKAKPQSVPAEALVRFIVTPPILGRLTTGIAIESLRLEME